MVLMAKPVDKPNLYEAYSDPISQQVQLKSSANGSVFYNGVLGDFVLFLIKDV